MLQPEYNEHSKKALGDYAEQHSQIYKEAKKLHQYILSLSCKIAGLTLILSCDLDKKSEILSGITEALKQYKGDDTCSSEEAILKIFFNENLNDNQLMSIKNLLSEIHNPTNNALLEEVSSNIGNLTSYCIRVVLDTIIPFLKKKNVTEDSLKYIKESMMSINQQTVESLNAIIKYCNNITINNPSLTEERLKQENDTLSTRNTLYFNTNQQLSNQITTIKSHSEALIKYVKEDNKHLNELLSKQYIIIASNKKSIQANQILNQALEQELLDLKSKQQSEQLLLENQQEKVNLLLRTINIQQKKEKTKKGKKSDNDQDFALVLIDKLCSTLGTLHENFQALKKEKQSGNKGLKKSTEEVENLKQENKNLTSEIDCLKQEQSQNKNLTSEIESLKQEHSQNKDLIDKKDLIIKALNATLEKEKVKTKKLNQGSENSKEKLQNKVNSLGDQNQNLKLQISTKDQKIQQLEKDLETTRKQNKELKKQPLHKSQQKRNDKDVKTEAFSVDEVQKKLDRLLQEVSELKTGQNQSHQVLVAVRTTLSSHTKQQQSKEGQKFQEISSKLESAIETIRATDTKNSKKMESFGAALNQLNQQTDKIASELKGLLGPRQIIYPPSNVMQNGAPYYQPTTTYVEHASSTNHCQQYANNGQGL